jgi:hypothetical protein
MALTTCKECQGKVSTTAAACPHCGAAIKDQNKSGCGTWLLGGIILVIVFIILGSLGGTSGSNSGKSSRTIKVSISIGRTELRITNLGSADWTEAIVYINGTPPFTYKQSMRAPTVGNTIAMPLLEFVTKDGDRFNPYTKAVREVWVGGSGYDYQSYTIDR